MVSPPLPSLADYPDARVLADGLRMPAWSVRGYLHGATRTDEPIRARALSSILFVGSIATFPLLLVLQPMLIGLRPRTRYYMPPERDAVIAITTRADSWHVADHSTARPGTKRGRQLRRDLAPLLTELLDAADAELLAVAVNEKMATRYEEDLPGLLRTGEKGWPRGLKMRRPRRSETQPPAQ